MPLRIFQSESVTYDALYDAVMMAMASSYPHITQSQEARLKVALLKIIEDPERKPRDPAELMRLFREAMDGV